MLPIDEESDEYGVMPVEPNYQTGYHVSLERRNPPPTVSTARNVARSWGGSSGSGTQRRDLIFAKYLYELGVEF